MFTATIGANTKDSRQEIKQARWKRQAERSERRKIFLSKAGTKWYVQALYALYTIACFAALAIETAIQVQVNPSRYMFVAISFFVIWIFQLPFLFQQLFSKTRWYQWAEKRKHNFFERVFTGVLFGWLGSMVLFAAVTVVSF